MGDVIKGCKTLLSSKLLGKQDEIPSVTCFCGVERQTGFQLHSPCGGYNFFYTVPLTHIYLAMKLPGATVLGAGSGVD